MDDQPPHSDLPPELPDEPSDPRWEAIARDVAGEGNAASEAAVRAWRRDAPDEAAAVEALDRALDRLTFAVPPDLDVEGALRRVKARRAEPRIAEPPAADAPRVLPFRAPTNPPARSPARSPVRGSGWPALARVAAVLLVAVGGFAAWRATRDRPSAGGSDRTLTTAVGARDSVRLPDGTRVLLGPATTLTVVADYGAARREVRLRGEAFFAVRHDARTPFVVRTDAASIHDVGTAFVVRDGSDGRVTVAVTEGSVLMRASGADSAAGVLVPARARATVVPGRAPVVQANVVTDASTAWTRGQLAFVDATFPDVAAELRRWYGIEVRAADPSLEARHLTAAFHGESADEVLRVVGLALGASVERRGDTAFVHASH